MSIATGDERGIQIFELGFQGVSAMVSKSDTARSELPPFGALPIFPLGKSQTEAMFSMQKEMISAYEHASRSWVDRVKAEVELWSELTSKLSAGGSAPESLQAYQDCVAKRMKMAAEDGQRLFEEGQRFVSAITRSLGNGSRNTTS